MYIIRLEHDLKSYKGKVKYKQTLKRFFVEQEHDSKLINIEHVMYEQINMCFKEPMKALTFKNKTKCPIDTTASYNSYGWKNG